MKWTLIFVGLLSTICCECQAENWAHWRGPTGNGAVADATPDAVATSVATPVADATPVAVVAADAVCLIVCVPVMPAVADATPVAVATWVATPVADATPAAALAPNMALRRVTANATRSVGLA